MKILFISRAYPPVVGGIEMQNYGIAKALGKLTETKIIANKKGKKFLPLFLPWLTLKLFFLIPSYDAIVFGDGVLSPIGAVMKFFYRKQKYFCIVHGLDITYASKNSFFGKIYKFVNIPSEKKMDKLINEGTKSEADIKKKKKEEEVKEINEITKRYINKYKSSPLRHFPTSPLRNYHKTKSEDSSIESPLNYVNNYNHNQRDSPHPNHLSLSPGSNNNYSPIEHSIERANNINTHWVEDIMTLTKCTKEKAMLSLIDSDGDIVGAIMKITSEMNENEENKNNNEI